MQVIQRDTIYTLKISQEELTILQNLLLRLLVDDTYRGISSEVRATAEIFCHIEED